MIDAVAQCAELDVSTATIIRIANEFPSLRAPELVAISHSGREAVLAYQSSVVLWDIQEKKVIAQSQTQELDPSCVFIGSNNAVIVGSRNGSVFTWMPGQAEFITLKGVHDRKKGGVLSVTISRDGNLLASSGCDGIIRVWSRDGNVKHELACNTVARVLCFGLTGEELFSGHEDGSIMITDVSGKLTPIRTLREHTRSITALCLAGDVLISGSMDRTIVVWNPK
jgi:WD40 repeat protein